jgi:hypothetical protein
MWIRERRTIPLTKGRPIPVRQWVSVRWFLCKDAMLLFKFEVLASVNVVP